VAQPVELDFRSSCGIDVTLLWDPSDNTLAVHVVDWQTGGEFAMAVAPERALEALHHPYAFTGRTSGELVLQN
jgi:hypothetical protein